MLIDYGFMEKNIDFEFKSARILLSDGNDLRNILCSRPQATKIRGT